MSARPSNVIDFPKVAERVVCDKCKAYRLRSGFYIQKGGDVSQPCRACVQGSQKGRALHVVVTKQIAAVRGGCTCGCVLGAHASGGKGPCANCGNLKCPSYFEKGL